MKSKSVRHDNSDTIDSSNNNLDSNEHKSESKNGGKGDTETIDRLVDSSSYK